MADTTVKPNALPLQLYLKIAEQPSAASLPLTLNAKLGEFTKLYFATALPLPLTQKISEQLPSNRLPLTLNRKLGTLDVVAPIAPVEPPKPKRYISGIGMALTANQISSINIAQGNRELRLAAAIAETARAYRQMGVNIADDYYSLLKPFINLGNATAAEYGDVINLANQFDSYWYQYVLLANATRVNVSDTVGLATVLINDSASVVSFDKPQFEPQQPAIGLATSLQNNEHGVFIGKSSQSRTQHAVPVPWRYYAIPEPPPPPAVFACRVRPPSSRLPLNLTRKHGGLPSSSLPLPLMCWHDNAPSFIPNLRSYVMHNVITATIGGVAVDLVRFDIKTDIQSYCWSGSIELAPSQYDKVANKLALPRGREPLVTVTVNGFVFAFLAEDLSRRRQFISHSYTVSGRSVTAQLGADYAHAQGGTLEQDLYASQLIQQQLADLPVKLGEFLVKDWLIAAGVYNLTNKTPIAVIADVAKACGGVVVSHASAAKLSVIPRWKKPAWELATATPDVVLNLNVVKSISDQKQVNPRYNTVTLIGGTTAAEVYRERQGRELIAPIDSNPLYGDRDGVVAKGIEILSNSGTHGMYSVQMRWAAKYNIALAELGQIWRVNDADGAWHGVVTSVAVKVDWDNDAPVVWQVVGLDRYLDV